MDDDNDELDAIARQLRWGPAGAELRAEAEETERESHQRRMRRRALSDVVATVAHRGDLVTVLTGGRALTGTVVAGGNDFLTLETGDLEVDVRLAAAVLRVERRSSGGVSTLGGSRTLHARLAEYEQTGEPVTLVAPSLDFEKSGRVAVVATDHVLLLDGDGAECYLPLAAVTLVLRRRPPRRH